MLEASNVFSMTTNSLATKQIEATQRSDASSVYLRANPGGKGIERLKEMYKAFIDEQEDKVNKQGGPGQALNVADLFLNNVFANPLLRGTEIVTDPVFRAYLEKNKKQK